MADLPRLCVFALGLALAGTVTRAGASEPAAPPIDLVAEVRQVNYPVYEDGNPPVIFDVERAISDGSIFSYYSVCRLGPVDAVTDPLSTSTRSRDDAFNPCLRSSCTSFSGEVTR